MCAPNSCDSSGIKGSGGSEWSVLRHVIRPLPGDNLNQMAVDQISRVHILAWLWLAAGCSQTVETTGPGSLVASRVRGAIVTGDSLARGEDYYGPGAEVEPDEGMLDAGRRHYPERGQFSFLSRPAGKFSGTRVVDITIRPWDERPDVERKVIIEAWHWNLIPPLTKGSDGTIIEIVADRVREACDRTGAARAGPTVGAAEPAALPGIENLVAFADGFTSGSAPLTDAAFNSLEAMQVKTIVSVDGACPDAARASQRGITTIHLPISYDWIAPERQRELARAVRDARERGAVYIHCHHGKHRSAAAAAMIAASLGWATPEQGVARMRVAGTAEEYAGLYECAAKAAVLDGALVDGVATTFVDCEPPSDLVATMVAMDDAQGNLREWCSDRSAFWRATAGVSKPIATAASLSEHLRRLAGGTEASARGEAFVADLRACSEKASALEAVLIAKGRSLKRANEDALWESVQALDASCSACHAKFRD